MSGKLSIIQTVLTKKINSIWAVDQCTGHETASLGQKVPRGRTRAPTTPQISNALPETTFPPNNSKFKKVL